MATLARAGLRLLETPYSAAVRLRNWRYDTGRAEVHRVSVPVLSVGNLTLGGSGKTPTVEFLARWFLARGVRVGLVSRGYGAEPGRPNDEALELAQKLPEVPHVLDRNRVRGAQRAIDEFNCQLILLDDGFQHRRLERDFDLVLVDALEPTGWDHVFPRGTLREPLAGWARAQALVLTRAELVDKPTRQAIRQQVARYAPQAIWAEATHAPEALQAPNGTMVPLAQFSGKPVAAFCGIGNPAGFERALAGCGYTLAGTRVFADHFAYQESNLQALAEWSNSLNVEAVICTGKDLVKLGTRWTGNKPLFALVSRLRFLAGQSELELALAPLVSRAKATQ